MLNFIKTPSGDLIARHLIQRVSHIPKKGVTVKDSYNHMLAYVVISDDTLAIRVRDLFNEVVLAGRNAKQPDWSFLTPAAPAPAPVVAKSPKVHKAADLPTVSSDDTPTEA